MFYLRPALEYCITACHTLINFMQFYATLCVALRRSARLCEIDSACSAVIDRQRVQCSLYHCTCSSPLTVHSVCTGYVFCGTLVCQLN